MVGGPWPQSCRTAILGEFTPSLNPRSAPSGSAWAEQRELRVGIQPPDRLTNYQMVRPVGLSIRIRRFYTTCDYLIVTISVCVATSLWQQNLVADQMVRPVYVYHLLPSMRFEAPHKILGVIRRA